MPGRTLGQLEKIVDAQGGKALLTGQIMGLLMKAQADGGLLGVLDVRPVLDDAGNYRPQIDVTMRSGTYRINVMDEYLIDEEP